jgi:hypothetical protein
MKSEEYKTHLYLPNTDKYKLLAHLKNEGDIEKIKKIVKSISSHPFIKSVLKSNVIPKKYSDLRKSRIIPFSGNFIGEASFYLITLEEEKAIVNSFLALKDNYEKEILLENYDSANKLLIEIEKVSGKSLWLIENKILLKEYQDGVKANWSEVSELSKNIQDPFVLFFVENLSKRAETKISYFRYLNIFNNQINETLVYPELYEYLCFKLNYLAISSYNNFAYFLFIESTSAIVDRYLILKEILSEMFSSELKEYSEILFQIANKLHQIFPDDIQLCQILSILSPKYIVKLPSKIQLNILLSEYSRGNYSFCIKNGVEFINNNPTIIEAYELYIKSLIEVQEKLESDKFSNNIFNILNTLFEIYSNQDGTNQLMDFGLKICTAFSSTSWAKQFLSLIKSSASFSNGNKLFNSQFVLNSKIRNPRILYYILKDNISQYTISFENELQETTSIISDIIKGNYEVIQNIKSLTEYKKDIYYGRALLKANEFQMGKSHFELISNKNNSNPLFSEEVIVNLFRCYIKLNLNKEACCLFVEHHLKNKEITKRLNKLKLLNSLESGDIEIVKNLIELPIFYSIASIDSYQQYVAYDTFIESGNFTRPTELIYNGKGFDTKLIYFLREVCTIEIMHHSYHFNGTDDIENERLEILNSLIVADKLNEDIYIKEITELNQNANIRKAIREVNKGRISINVNQLRNNEINNIKEAFSRYREIESYSRTKEIIGIDASISMLSELNDLKLDEILGNRAVYKDDPAFISFKAIFIEIRDKFLLSKEYGLDGYLSTRIRHGTLLNHIRSTFESENIISQRDKDNIYLENEFWNDAIPYYLVEKKPKIQEVIKKFSRLIDEYTEFIIKELIQIKTEKNVKKPKALFDFSITNQELGFLFKAARENIKEHNQFLSFVFEYLEAKTEILLRSIRQIINLDINNNYNVLLQDFNTEIKGIIEGYNYPELTGAISLCGTRLQNELKSISEWFYLSNSSKDLVLDLKVLFQTAIQITNTIYPNSKLIPTINEKHSVPMVGTIHLIYVSRILLDNIIIHSKVSPSDLIIEISSLVTDEEFLEICFKNNLSVLVDKEILKNKLELVKNKWDFSSDDYENIDIEGGSGFDKIRRIIAFDLGCERYKFDYTIEGDFLTIKLSIEFLNITNYNEKN